MCLKSKTYLGFSWKINNIVKFFVFTVLPFGLSAAPFAFIKVVRPLVKYWRFNSIKIVCFLEDGLDIGSTFEKALEKSTFVSNSLTREGFIVNSEKSALQPTKILTCHHFHSILRLFDVLSNFRFTTSETMRGYYL